MSEDVKFFRCRCGLQEAYSSMGIPACSGCETCGTTLEVSPKDHKEPIPHEFTVKSVEMSHLGKSTFMVCKFCSRSELEVAELKQRATDAARDGLTLRRVTTGPHSSSNPPVQRES